MLLEVRPLIRGAGVVVWPSVLDATPLVVIESQLSATPVVASRVGSAPGMILDGETGFLCHSRDIEGFCKTILALYENRARRDEMGRRAREWANEMFSPAAMKAGFCSLVDGFVRAGKHVAASAGRL